MKKLTKKQRYDISLALLIVVIVTFLVLGKENLEIFENRGAFQDHIMSFGILAPIAIIVFIMLEVIIAPLPGFIPAVSAGFIFGPTLGTFYAYTGNVLGSTIVFILARKLGKYYINRFANQEKVGKYEAIIEKNNKWLIFLFIFPLLPTDLISIALGVSKIKFKRFFIYMTIGYLINVLLLNIFGDFLAKIYF